MTEVKCDAYYISSFSFLQFDLLLGTSWVSFDDMAILYISGYIFLSRPRPRHFSLLGLSSICSCTQLHA